MRRVLVLTAALAAALGAQAGEKTRADDNACVFVRSIHDFKPLDRNTLVIWSPGRRNAYLVALGMPLPELKFAHRLAFVDRDHNGQLCGYGMDRVAVPGSGFHMPSTIMGMTRLDAARIAELEAQYDVKLTRKSKDAKTPDVSRSAHEKAA